MLHNLLDEGIKKELRNEYHARIVIVVGIFASGVMGVGILSGIPAYVSVRGELDTYTTTLTQSVTVASSTEVGGQSLDIIARTNTYLALLEENLEKDNLAELIHAAFSERPEGVFITGLAYDRSRNFLTVEGVALNRDVFRIYSQKLESHAWFVDVPQSISHLTKNTDLPFRLALTIVPKEQR